MLLLLYISSRHDYHYYACFTSLLRHSPLHLCCLTHVLLPLLQPRLSCIHPCVFPILSRCSLTYGAYELATVRRGSVVFYTICYVII